ncbi:MAG: 1-deoxy-D-xylulose-5-phosphate reductoisomerase [Spirochaetes bacterium]|nr:MAG: 1-deoxy-D-xylulose-5-phosphate reductoisomerase [Spirochaetota bacterium]
MSRTVTILGSTGSIGVSALRVLGHFRDEFRVLGLSCNRNLELLARQIREFSPRAVAVGAPDLVKTARFSALRETFPSVEFLTGPEGIRELASREADILVSALVGAAGLLPTLAALPHVKRVALANKETLVMAGELFMKRVAECGVELIPVDSEHSAVFSLLDRVGKEDLARIVLTASGGSLRDRPAAELASVTPAEALAHPTWSMGSKITIDSATMMNKGLEVIEAHHLFGAAYDIIDVVLHPESVVHSMVEARDGGIYAFLSVTDMALPIMNALMHPEKRANPFGRLDLAGVGRLTFGQCDSIKFPALELCYRAGRAGGTLPAVLNGANEVAVGLFLNHEIRFTDIVRTVERVMDEHVPESGTGIEDIFRADEWARERAYTIARG